MDVGAWLLEFRFFYMFLSFILSLILLPLSNVDNLNIADGFSDNQAGIEEVYQQIPQKNPASESLGVKLSAKHAALLDRKTGALLFEKNAEEAQPIASITKLMSALVFLDYNPGWQGEITMEKSDERNGGYFHVYQGETLYIKDLFNLGLVASDNNAIIALARSTGLSEKQFVEEMNKTAIVLGLNNTSFVDPTGLSPQNVSTAIDVAKMLNYILTKQEIKDASLMTEYKFTIINNKRKVTVQSTDILLDSYLNDKSLGYKIIGGKTGYLTEAGYCLALSVAKDGNEVIGVVLGSDTIDSRFQEIKGMITWGFDNYIWSDRL